MSDFTTFPDLFIARLQTPTNPNPRLAQTLDSDDLTIFLTAPIEDSDGNVPTQSFYMVVVDSLSQKPEEIFVDIANLTSNQDSISVDGKTITLSTLTHRGLPVGGVSGIDPESGIEANRVKHNVNSEARLNISEYEFQLMESALKGVISSGGANWQIGKGVDEDITVWAANGDANLPYWRYDSATDKWIFSNDGISSSPFGTGAGVTGGDGITVTAGDIDIDVSDTSIFVKTSSGAADEDHVPILDATGKLAGGFLPEEELTLTAGENLTAEDVAYIETDGKAYKTVRNTQDFVQLGAIASTPLSINTLKLADNKVIAVYVSGTGLFGVVVNMVRTTATPGTETSIVGSVQNEFRATIIGTNKFVAAYRNTADGDKLYAVVCTVSGTTISAGTPVKLYDTEIVNNGSIDVCKLDDDKFLVSFTNAASADVLAVACTVSGTVITAGTSALIDTTTSIGDTLCAQLTTDAACVVYDDGTDLTYVNLTISGTTITVKTATALYAGSINQGAYNSGLIVLDERNVLFYRYNNPINVSLRVSRIFNSDILIFGNPPAYNESQDAYLPVLTSSKSVLFRIGEDKVGLLNAENNNISFNQYKIINNSFELVFSSNGVGGISVTHNPSAVGIFDDQNRAIMFFRDSGDGQKLKYSIFLDTSAQYIGVANTTETVGNPVVLRTGLNIPFTSLSVGQPYFVGDAGALATNGQRQIGIATTTTNLRKV